MCTSSLILASEKCHMPSSSTKKYFQDTECNYSFLARRLVAVFFLCCKKRTKLTLSHDSILTLMRSCKTFQQSNFILLRVFRTQKLEHSSSLKEVYCYKSFVIRNETTTVVDNVLCVRSFLHALKL